MEVCCQRALEVATPSHRECTESVESQQLVDTVMKTVVKMEATNVDPQPARRSQRTVGP